MKDLRQLPRFSDGLSYVYLERCRIDQEGKAIAAIDEFGRTPIPVASLALVMLGPGTTITHAAIRAAADNGCLIHWVGEEGVRFYAQGLGTSRSARNIIHQASLVSDPELRLEVVMRMYRKRFAEGLPDNVSLQQIRGYEGRRVRDAYAKASAETGVEWTGRSYDRKNWRSSSAVNRALSAANSCLYGCVHAGIVSAGYSPALGFIHTGKNLSFVYDIADLYKAEITIPTAFRVTAENPKLGLESLVRRTLRDTFRRENLLARLISDINELLDFKKGQHSDFDKEVDVDDALPGWFWDPELTTVRGGTNYDPDGEV